MDEYKLFEKEEFNCLTNRQKELLMQLSKVLQGKTAAEAAGFVMKAMPLLEKEGSLTNEQKKAMAVCILSNMSEDERSRLLTIFRFAGVI